MKLKNLLKPAVLSALLFPALQANERYFGYVYEPETMPKEGLEFEQWITLRTQRNKAVGQENYNRWQFREELEYGVTDRYTASLYLNFDSEHDRAAGTTFKFEGVSLENRYMVLNPAEHAVGLSLYLEPRFSGDEAEIEQKIILGQRHGDWKWAFNLSHATEWENDLHDIEGEFEASFGITRHLNKNWALGVEARDINVFPDYRRWEYTSVYVGPVVTYHQDKWWATLTVMPQVFGRNYLGEPDARRNLVLDEQERVNIRLLFGVAF